MTLFSAFDAWNNGTLSGVASLLFVSLGWRHSAVGRVSDLRSRGRGFDSWLGTRRNNSGQVSHTYVPLFTKRYKLVPAKGGDALRLGSEGRYGLCVSGR